MKSTFRNTTVFFVSKDSVSAAQETFNHTEIALRNV